MADILTLTGFVATVPRHIITGENLPITTFRLASTQRRYDRSKDCWVDGDTNWYTITTFRQLAINASASISKGDRIIVTGRLRIREWKNGEKTGTNVDVEADGIGHDQAWGTTVFTRTIVTTPAAVDAGTEQSPAPQEKSEDEQESPETRATEETQAAVPSVQGTLATSAVPF